MLKAFAALVLGLVLLGSIRAQTNRLSSSNLPIIVINTNGLEIPDDPKIMADMGIIDNGPGRPNNITDTFTQYKGKIGIEIRGQSSQMFPMKSYSLELWDNTGRSINRSLFGLPSESDWVLYAPYTDKTLMRNVLAYQLSRDLGWWAANCRFVEVVLNGDYRGIYVFMERIKRNVGRVNISRIRAADSTGDALTGGYIFSLDKEPDGWFSKFPPINSTNNNTRQFSYVTPKLADITNPQKTYLRSYVDSFEAVLAGQQFQDPVNGVRKFANLASFMDYFIVNEVSRNVDGFRLSTYMYKDRNSIDRRIVMGPVWDYDLAFRNANYCSGSDVRGWAYQFNQVCPGDGAGLIPFWWDRLMQDTAWVSALRCRWKEARRTTLSTARLNRYVDSVATLVDAAQKRHFARWPVLGIYIWPNPQPIPKSYAEEISMLKDWLELRLRWIDDNIPDAGPCADIGLIDGNLQAKVFPNPIGDEAQVTLLLKIDQVVDMRVVDMSGHVLMARRQYMNRGRYRIPLNSAQWSRGMYFLEVNNNRNEGARYRLMKQ